jgi:Amidase
MRGSFATILYGTDNSYKNLRTPIRRDPMEPSVRFLLTLGRLPSSIRAFLAFLIYYLLRDPVGAAGIRLVDTKSGAEVKSWVYRRDVFRQQFNDWFQAQGLDAIIAPTSTVPATKHNGTKMVSALAISTALYNVVDWPVGIVPVTKVKEGEVMPETRWKGKEKDGHSWMFLDQVYGSGGVYKDIAEGGVGLPVGVQVMYFLAKG